ncbi:MAG TPA: hypothetical protein VGK00_03015 [Anaerolineales bacterium]|jgi:hypothetical protein
MIKKNSKLLAHLLLAVMLFVGASAASAAPASDHQVVTGTASFSLPAGQCPALPAGVSVSGAGESVAVINTQTRADGSIETRINNVIKGVATDSNGGRHLFEYQNFSTDVRLTSGTHTISMTDTFVLNGPGPQFSVGFNWRWTYTEFYWPPQDNWTKISTRGDVFACDPL